MTIIIPPGIVAAGLIPPVTPGESIAKYTYAYTGADVDVIAPAGAGAVRVKLWGAGGNGGVYSGGVYGGGGGYTEAEFAITAGQKVTVQVGEGGRAGVFGLMPKMYPDGGPGSFGDTAGGGGGGSSRVWIDEVIKAVAGGGAGAAGFVGWGGLGGGTNGGGGSAGAGGTQLASPVVGAPAGLATYAGDPTGEGGGNFRNGRLAALSWANRLWQRGGYGGVQGGGTGDDGGGGGGGFYGGAGGGGDGRSGGGGSGHVAAGALLSFMLGGVHINSVYADDIDYPGGIVSRGTVSNSGTAGGNGYIVVDFLSGPTPVDPDAQSPSLQTSGGPPDSSVSRLGNRWTSGPAASANWHKSGSRIARRAQDGPAYYELALTEKLAGTTFCYGVADVGIALTSGGGFPNNAGEAGRYQYFESGQKRSGGIYSAYGAAFTQGDVMGLQIANEGGTTIIRGYKNGVDQGVMFNLGSIATFWEPHFCNYGNGASKVIMDMSPILYLPPGAVKWA